MRLGSGQPISAYLLIPVFVVAVAGAIVFLLSGVNVAQPFTEERCLKKLQLPDEFFQRASYEERHLDYNIDRTPAEGVLWKIYSSGKRFNRTFVGVIKTSEQMAYTVFSGNFQGCGKLMPAVELSVPQGAAFLACRAINIYVTGEKTGQYFSVSNYLQGSNTSFESLDIVALERQDGMLDYYNSLYDSLRCKKA
ncbi:MAG: hypothetical protein HY516_02820 [Candidatus Aenigmarchaeota archaeon]|nr:hypothetical protein [Candidatus Aenigmarchaeota archaeon]